MDVKVSPWKHQCQKIIFIVKGTHQAFHY